MLSNGNTSMAFNSFREMPQIPYKILEELLSNEDNNETVENFWKLLKYTDMDALDKDNLTEEEKDAIIWRGESTEQDYNIFIKPLIGSSLDTSESQTQMRLYRYSDMPISRYEAIACFEFDLITNEKTSVVYYNGMLCERTDLMEAFIIDIFNGRDIGIGSGVLEYNRELSRSCQSLMSINNSKNMYGRAVVMALSFNGGESGGCG